MSHAAVETVFRPMLFSGPMVRAILDGRKTQTRRVVDIVKFGGPSETHNSRGVFRLENGLWRSSAGMFNVWSTGKPCPYGQPGDRLWVRETFQFVQANSDGQRRTFNSYEPFKIHDYQWIEYAATPRDEPAIKWKPSIFMPRWASRITLEITGIRVERLQDISAADAMAEGLEKGLFGDSYVAHGFALSRNAVGAYEALWDSINGKTHPWKSNPWVWVIEFKKL